MTYTKEQIETEAQQWLDEFIRVYLEEERLEDFFQQYGKYMQAIAIPETIPQDGVTETVDLELISKPTDMPVGWKDSPIATELDGTELPFQIRVDNYMAPQGSGALLRVQYIWEKTRQELVYNYGPLTQLDTEKTFVSRGATT